MSLYKCKERRQSLRIIYRRRMVMKRNNKFKLIRRSYLSDYFVCRDCGYGIYAKILGNTKICPECGGKMVRQ